MQGGFVLYKKSEGMVFRARAEAEQPEILVGES